MSTSTIPAFLGWAASSAGLVAIASFLLERLSGFQSLTSKQRLVIIVAVVLVIPQLVLIITKVVPNSTWATLQPYWQSLVTSIVVLSTFLASEGAHAVDKKLSQ